MDRKASVRLGGAAAALAAVFLTFANATMFAQSENSAGGLVGTWAVQVTLRDCATNAALGPPFRSVGTFHQGGTLSDSTAGLAFAIGQRTMGHGTWTRETGRRFSQGGHRYSQVILALLLFDSPANLPGTPGFDPTKPVTPGFLAGWQIVRHDIHLTDRDHWESEGTNEFYNTSGEVYRKGCSTAVATRLE